MGVFNLPSHLLFAFPVIVIQRSGYLVIEPPHCGGSMQITTKFFGGRTPPKCSGHTLASAEFIEAEQFIGAEVVEVFFADLTGGQRKDRS